MNPVSFAEKSLTKRYWDGVFWLFRARKHRPQMADTVPNDTHEREEQEVYDIDF